MASFWKSLHFFLYFGISGFFFGCDVVFLIFGMCIGQICCDKLSCRCRTFWRLYQSALSNLTPMHYRASANQFEFQTEWLIKRWSTSTTNCKQNKLRESAQWPSTRNAEKLISRSHFDGSVCLKPLLLSVWYTWTHFRSSLSHLLYNRPALSEIN